MRFFVSRKTFCKYSWTHIRQTHKEDKRWIILKSLIDDELGYCQLKNLSQFKAASNVSLESILALTYRQAFDSSNWFINGLTLLAWKINWTVESKNRRLAFRFRVKTLRTSNFSQRASSTIYRLLARTLVTSIRSLELSTNRRIQKTKIGME